MREGGRRKRERKRERMREREREKERERESERDGGERDIVILRFLFKMPCSKRLS